MTFVKSSLEKCCDIANQQYHEDGKRQTARQACDVNFVNK